MALKRSRAEELALESEIESQQFLDEKLAAATERSAQIANLKALRREKEQKQRKAARKLAKAVNKQ